MTLETRIRELCRKAVTARDHEIEPVIADLKSALREHMQHTRQLLFSYPFSPDFRETRRTEMAQP